MRVGITDAVKHILIINVLMFIGTLSIGNGETFFRWFALYFPKNDFFEPWQIVSHMFMHGNFSHILFNMFALWMFGTTVEQVFGFRKFLIFYLLCGLGAASIMIAYYYFQYLPLETDLVASGLIPSEIKAMLANNEVIRQISSDQKMMLQQMFDIYHASMVGASGAIMGVLVAFGMLFPESKLMLIFLPIPIKAKYFIPGIIALDLFSAITGQSIFSPSNTAYVAHIGGAITGFLLMWFWKKNEMDRFRWN